MTTTTTTTTTPRIYVASLSDYNAGRLHGVWIDADDEYESIQEAITEMLARSVEPGAEEFAIHDYEGFGPYKVDEYESIESVNRVAEGISEHGDAFAHWAAYVDDLDELDAFEDRYIGHYDSMVDYAEQLVDDRGLDAALDKADLGSLRSYVRVDTEMLARDLESEYAVSEGDGGVFIFTA